MSGISQCWRNGHLMSRSAEPSPFSNGWYKLEEIPVVVGYRM